MNTRPEGGFEFDRSPILEVDDLAIDFRTEQGWVHAVRGVSFRIHRGKTVALLGESGCGKSVTGLALLGLIDPPGRISRGRILWHSPFVSSGEGPVDIASLPSDSAALRKLRGNAISMIFQEPRASLTPVYTVGAQIMETVRLHRRVSRGEARARAVELLQLVGIPAPDRRLAEYPHQLSGGMCQRVMIAMALACNPALLIADEPTTALDVTIQAAVLDLLKSIQQDLGMSVFIITHDLGVVAEIADEVIVMYLGKIAERGPVREVFSNPRHPYTKGLLKSIPRPGSDPKDPLPRIPGSVPDLFHIPEGCPFRGRCPEEMPICRVMPEMQAMGNDALPHTAACWLYQEEESLDEADRDRILATLQHDAMKV